MIYNGYHGVERDDSRQPSHFMKCRLCQPIVFSGIFTLFGASDDGAVYHYSSLLRFSSFLQPQWIRKNRRRLFKEYGKLYAVLFKLPTKGSYLAYENYDDDDNYLLHYRLLIYDLTILHLGHNRIYCTLYSLHTKICYKENPFSCLENCHTNW